MTDFEFLIGKRPVSLQAKKKSRLQDWKLFVNREARKAWTQGLPVEEIPLSITLVYLCDESPGDTDNIVKPIQDALRGVVYSDDSLIADVRCFRRPLAGTFDPARLPRILVDGILSESECVYVRISDSPPLEELL